jgi:DNA oxidative demethylase
MSLTAELFDGVVPSPSPPEKLCDGAMVLRGFALACGSALFDALAGVLAEAPLRHMLTPGGRLMSVAMSNCGALGWVSDRSGYRYDHVNPESGAPWPAMPPVFAELAGGAATRAGYTGFVPDACLINRYAAGARLTLHQDRDERDFTQPIVSVSLGLAARFQFGGLKRSDRRTVVPLHHGDVVVWGGPARLRYHGVLPLREGLHPSTGACRINLTFRRAA